MIGAATSSRYVFCAVRRLEPKYVGYLPLKRQVRGIEQVYGPKRDLLLLDNNVLASDHFEDIIRDIVELGFERGAKAEGKLRRLDFNQGIDARRLAKKHVQLLSQTALSPMRLAFDSIAMRDQYIRCVRMCCDYGLTRHSTYVLYNYTDTPRDFYERMRIGVLLNEELGAKISSFPMKYIPLDAKNRRFVGKNWSRKLIRGVQCILLATRGMVSPRREFFDAAFGRTPEEFIQIAMMPEPYIIYRRKHELNGASDWLSLYKHLSTSQRRRLFEVVGKGRVGPTEVARESSLRLKRILAHYADSAAEEAPNS